MVFPSLFLYKVIDVKLKNYWFLYRIIFFFSCVEWWVLLSYPYKKIKLYTIKNNVPIFWTTLKNYFSKRIWISSLPPPSYSSSWNEKNLNFSHHDIQILKKRINTSENDSRETSPYTFRPKHYVSSLYISEFRPFRQKLHMLMWMRDLQHWIPMLK